MHKKFKSWIHLVGAREHNLKNIKASLPKETLTVITGPSGSGKSSLALDVLYTEGKRRYTESLSAYARQFLGIEKKPDVDSIEGLCPAIAIEQKTVGSNPRSTVGTITEIYDYLRVLFARIGEIHCPDCKKTVGAQSPEAITQHSMAFFKNQTITIHAPVVQEEKGEFKEELKQWYQQGFYRFLINDRLYKFANIEEVEKIKLSKTSKHTIDILIDQVTVTTEEQSRIQESIEHSLMLAKGLVKIVSENKAHLYSSFCMCLNCGHSFPELEPRFFSFNSPIGACQKCSGLGELDDWSWNFSKEERMEHDSFEMSDYYRMVTTCKECSGQRLNKYALSVFINKKNIFQLCELSLEDLIVWFKEIKIDETLQTIAQPLFDEITKRLHFLQNVGLSYVTLNRSARTLSGGEGQRIRLATQIGSALSGVLYVLDEPSIGLHQKDNDRLIETLKNLRDQGNTVIVVEHDIDTIKEADYIIDMGPGAGVHGGMITAFGTPDEIKKNEHSLTGSYLSKKRFIAIPKKRRTAQGFLTLKHARKNNLKDLTVAFPLNVLCGISGVSGSGKSTLILEELAPALQKIIMYKQKKSENLDDLLGTEKLKSLVVIDQTPIGKTSRSNPATYLGVFNTIRALFACLPESNARGYKVGRFSFNCTEGRCFECNGDGSVTVSMHFLADVTMVCKTCKGKRYNKETLQILYRQKNIADVLDMTAAEAVDFFSAHKNIAHRLQLMCDVGLEYIKLGQPSPTLSGGEAQRIKLVDELAKRGNQTLYILDEPTTGLHSADIDRLLKVLNNLVDKGNSMIIIEHNLDVLKCVDYLIDMGPEGGKRGGQVIAHGTPEEIAKNKTSSTGFYLKKILS